MSYMLPEQRRHSSAQQPTSITTTATDDASFYSLDDSSAYLVDPQPYLLRSTHQAFGPQPRPQPISNANSTSRPFGSTPMSTEHETSRKQHTLDSIGCEKSGSRSPIVASDANLQAIDEVPLSTQSDSRFVQSQYTTIGHPSRINPTGDHRLDVLTQFGLASNQDRDHFQRRGFFEVGEPSEQQATGSESDSLSLDKILADIQSGKLVYSSDKETNQMSLENQTELREFRKYDPISGKSTQTPEHQRVEKHTVAPNESHLTTSTLSSSTISSITPIEKQVVDSSNASCGDDGQDDGALKISNAKKKQHEIESGFEVAWLDFTYSVEPNIFEDPRWGKINSLFHKERRMILKGLSGGFKSGQMVALMGPSGAGKTCLLESISGVRLTGIGGRLRIRGRRKAQLVIVPQYDDFLPQFTVEEIVIFGSRMKNPPGTNHRKVANKVIDQLGLQVCRSNNIQRCSGGQRKRVAIAQELVSRPNILILDEPTSGLDSSCCYHTMRVLRDVLDQSVGTEQPMAIVSTIHQPSAKVFKMFDLVYLLGKTGYTAYSGPPSELLPTIRDVTGMECPQYSNPSDFMIELVAYDYGEEPVEKLIEFEQMKAKQFVRDFDRRAGADESSSDRRKSSASATSSSTTLINGKLGTDRNKSSNNLLSGSKQEGLNMAGKLTPSRSDTHLVLSSESEQMQQRLKAQQLAVEHVEYKTNVTTQLRKATSTSDTRHPFFWHSWVHLHRSFLQAIRDPILNNMRILIHLGFAVLLVLLYGKKSGDARGCPPVLGLPMEITDPNNESMIDLADNIGYLFMCIMMITYVSLMSTVLTFPIDIKTVGKEYKNGWYGTFTYFIGKSIADLPFITMYPVAYCLITWYMTNQAQDHVWRYFSFTGLIIMNAMNSQSFGLILGAVFVNSVTAATFLGPVITIPWYLFTGFTKRVHRLSEPYKSASKFLFTRYVFEGLLDTVYGHERCNCSEFLQKYYELRYEEAVRLGSLISMETLSSLDYYDGLDTVANVRNETLSPKTSNQWFEKTVDAASTVFADGDELNLAGLMESNGKASSLFSFGLDFEPTCPSDYRNFVIQDFHLEDTTMKSAFVYTTIMLAVMRVLTFMVVTWKIRTRQL